MHYLTSNFGIQVEEYKSKHGDMVERRKDGDSSKKSALPVEPIDDERREKVKEAMLHAWNSYEKYAWGNDELQVCSVL